MHEREVITFYDEIIWQNLVARLQILTETAG